MGNDTNAPYVNFVPISLFLRDFWRHVMGRSTPSFHQFISIEEAGETEICKFDIDRVTFLVQPRINQDILWLNITVNYSLLMHIIQC